MSKICNITRGRVMSKQYLRDNVGDFPVYSSQTANNGQIGKIDTYDYDGEHLTWTTDGANAGTVFYRNGKFSITNVCGLLKIKDDHEVSAKYAKYALAIVTPGHVSSGMGNPKLMSNVMANIKIPIPPKDEQNRIANILDKFDELINGINEGLPAEINARRQQYGYYRNKLLTFEGATA